MWPGSQEGRSSEETSLNNPKEASGEPGTGEELDSGKMSGKGSGCLLGLSALVTSLHGLSTDVKPTLSTGNKPSWAQHW